MRVYRDIRFSADKTPHKTNIGIQFRHSAGKEVHAPGLYLHIDPDEVFLGAGMWHPEAPASSSSWLPPRPELNRSHLPAIVAVPVGSASHRSRARSRRMPVRMDDKSIRNHGSHRDP